MVGGYSVRIMPSADSDMTNIYNYIEENFGIDNADNTISSIKEKILGLKLVPKGATLYPKKPWKEKGLWMVHVKNYTIFYFVFDEMNVVKVVKIAYSAMDFDSLLEKLENEW